MTANLAGLDERPPTFAEIQVRRAKSRAELKQRQSDKLNYLEAFVYEVLRCSRTVRPPFLARADLSRLAARVDRRRARRRCSVTSSRPARIASS